MNTSIDSKQYLQEKFSEIFEPSLLNEMADVGRLWKVKEGEVLIEIGQTLAAMPIVISGAIRILRDDEDGNELFLYYLNNGDVCAMSMTCCIQKKVSEIRAIAETDSEIWMVPLQLMDEWMKKYASWRGYVLNSYNHRFEELLDAINSVAFMRMDERLMKYLLDKKQNSGSYIIEQTHQEIARALNTSRVVISRLLKQLERDEKIEMHRNRIEIL
ncbi:MAG: Crp/Fnr family transcriptional regulator [Bacteroidetes bacterium]|nr:Crp/Fnr family transcriptional regulator [Bacteroidota bacterium]MDA1120733.1 Crp/Fnr family transcriptional regulator [Bacteroidota bacterium]